MLSTEMSLSQVFQPHSSLPQVLLVVSVVCSVKPLQKLMFLMTLFVT